MAFPLAGALAATSVASGLLSTTDMAYDEELIKRSTLKNDSYYQGYVEGMPGASREVDIVGIQRELNTFGKTMQGLSAITGLASTVAPSSVGDIVDPAKRQLRKELRTSKRSLREGVREGEAIMDEEALVNESFVFHNDFKIDQIRSPGQEHLLNGLNNYTQNLLGAEGGGGNMPNRQPNRPTLRAWEQNFTGPTIDLRPGADGSFQLPSKLIGNQPSVNTVEMPLSLSGLATAKGISNIPGFDIEHSFPPYNKRVRGSTSIGNKNVFPTQSNPFENYYQNTESTKFVDRTY